MFAINIYFIFMILIHRSVNTISVNKKYCPPKKVFYTNEDSSCRISYTENFPNDYEKKTKDWIDEYLMGCFDDSSTKDFQTRASKLRMISCTNLVSQKNHMNISYIHHYNEGNEKFSTPGSMTGRKCCPQGQRYDTEFRECVNSSSNNVDVFNMLRDFSNKVINSLSIIQGPPTCNYAVINYVISTVDGRLVLYNDTYQGLTSSKIGKNELFLTENNACFDIGSSPNTLVVRVCSDAKFCERNTCLKKCCPEGEARIDRQCQKLSLFPNFKKRFHTEVKSFVNNTHNNSSLSDALKSTDYGLIIGLISCENDGPLLPVVPSENWYFTSSGYVYVPKHKSAHNHDGHCLEMVFGNNFIEGGLYPLMCFSEYVNVPDDNSTPVVDPFPSRVLIKAVSGTISCMFLLLTFFVYLSLPSLKNIHGITLMCHIGSFFLAYSSRATIIFLTIYDNMSPDYYLVESPICKALGYIMTASFLAAFSWLNIICFDIWWTLRGYNSVVFGDEKLARRKRFLLYSCYAWGLSLLLLLLIFILDSTTFIPDELRPHLGDTTCWLGQQNNGLPKVIYFYGPLTILLTINIIFFILTIRNCNKIKANISKFTSTNIQGYKASKAKAKLILKLFIVMGISWTFEIIAFFIEIFEKNLDWSVKIFTAFDIINCLHGVFIFILFVVKTDVYCALVQKFSRRQVYHSRFMQSTNYLMNIFKKSRSINSTSTLITSVTDSTKSP